MNTTQSHKLGPFSFPVILTSILLFLSSTSHFYSINIPFFGSLRVLFSIIIIFLIYNRIYNDLMLLNMRGILLFLILTVIYISCSSYFSGSSTFLEDSKLWFNNAIFYLIVFNVVRSSNLYELSLIFVSFSISFLLTGISYAAQFIPLLSSFSFPIVEGSSHQAAAQSAMIAMVITLLFRIKSFPLWVRLYGSLSLYTSIIVLIVSGARTPALSSIIVLMLWKKSKKWIFKILLTIAILLGIAATYANLDWALSRTERLYNAVASQQTTGVTEIEFRAKNVKLALQAFVEHPIWGIGYGHWQAYSSRFNNVVGIVLATHNGWANGLSELGIMGMTIYLLLLYRSVSGVKWSSFYSLQEAIHRMGFLAVCSMLVLSIGGDALIHRTMLVFMAVSAAGRDYSPIQPFSSL